MGGDIITKAPLGKTEGVVAGPSFFLLADASEVQGSSELIAEAAAGAAVGAGLAWQTDDCGLPVLLPRPSTRTYQHHLNP